jgi:hypothetical protein
MRIDQRTIDFWSEWQIGYTEMDPTSLFGKGCAI